VFCLAPKPSYRVDRGRHLASSTFGGDLVCGVLSLSDISGWRLVFFIPWRGVAENPARRSLLLDPPGPALRLLADVADFRFSDIPVRGDDGSERTSHGVDGADSPDRKPR
jgi:hypothetical protein